MLRGGGGCGGGGAAVVVVVGQQLSVVAQRVMPCWLCVGWCVVACGAGAPQAPIANQPPSLTLPCRAVTMWVCLWCVCAGRAPPTTRQHSPCSSVAGSCLLRQSSPLSSDVRGGVVVGLRGGVQGGVRRGGVRGCSTVLLLRSLTRDTWPPTCWQPTAPQTPSASMTRPGRLT